MIGDIIEATLPLMRAHAESLMDDTCTVERQDGPAVWDETEKRSVASWRTVYADVPCSVLQEPVSTRQVVTAEGASPSTPHVFIPVPFDGVKADDRVTITGLGARSSPDLLNAVLWVTHEVIESHVVQRHIECRRLK